MADKAPKPSDGIEQIIRWIESTSPSEAQKWLKANVGMLSDAQFAMLEEWSSGQQWSYTPGSPIPPVNAETGIVGSEAGVQEMQAMVGVTAEVTAERERRSAATTRREMPQEQRDAAVSGQVPPTAAADGAGGTSSGSSPEDMLYPDLFSQVYGARELTAGQRSDLVDAWNELNPDDRAVGFPDLLKKMKANQTDPRIKEALTYAATGLEPNRVWEFQISPRLSSSPSGSMFAGASVPTSSTSVRVSDLQMQALQTVYGQGFSSKDVKVFAQMAEDVDVKDALGGQPGWQIAAAFASLNGYFDLGETPGRVPSVTSGPRTPEAKKAFDKQVTAAKKNAAERQVVRNQLLKYREGLSIYGGNNAIAFIHATNPTVASKIATVKADKLSLADKQTALSLLSKAGFSQQTLDALGFGWTATLDDLPINSANQNGSGSGRQMPDPVAVKQAAKDMYRSLFAMDPDEATLNSLVAAFNSAAASSGDNQQVSADARIRQALESRPEYKDLYGRKPAGMSEAEYQTQFRAAAVDMMGQEAVSPDAIRSGMRTGDYQTTVGAAAGSKQAWNNSTFLGRLANASRVIAENT